MRQYLLHDDTAPHYYIGRRTEEELTPETIRDLEVGQTRMVSATMGVTRES